jgi:type IV pilus assembly protein PilV
VNRYSTKPMHYPKAIATGFSLLEILVAMLVIAIGVLGIAGLQASALRYSKASEARFLAVQLSNDLVERMRSNVAGMKNGEFSSLYAFQTVACNPSPPSPSTTVPASVQGIAWRNALACALPEGKGRLTVTPIGALPGLSEIEVTVEWNESRLKGGSASQRLVTRTAI